MQYVQLKFKNLKYILPRIYAAQVIVLFLF